LKRNSRKTTQNKEQTTLGGETEFRGKMSFENVLRVKGRYQGNIDSSGFLMVEEGAEVRADIKVESVVIGGVVYGNIEAKDRLEILPTGKVFGNIRTTHLKIADGVLFEGKCDMIGNDRNNIDIFSAPLDQLKKNLIAE